MSDAVPVGPDAGIAGPAGHIDDHGGPEAAVSAEVAEEVGLTVVRAELIAQGFRPGACRRPGWVVGHDWWLFDVQTEGDLNPSQRETMAARWRSPAELQEAAGRTIAQAHGRRVFVEDFAADNRIEPVWVRWLMLAGVITVTLDDLYAVDQLLRRGHG